MKYYLLKGLSGIAVDLSSYIKHSLATAANDFLAASGSGAYVKKTLAETLTILGKAAASGLASLNASTKVVEQPASISDHLDNTAGGTDAEVTKAPTSNVMYDHAALTTAHGVTGAIVGTTDNQTLTTKTLTSPTINGTVATIGLTMPAFILNGAISSGVENPLFRTVDYGLWRFSGGIDNNSALISLLGKSHATNPGEIQIHTPNAALSATLRLTITGAVDTAVAACSNLTWTGLVLSGDLNANTSYQITNLQAPAASGEAIRQTAKITEVALEDAVDKKHAANADTDLDATFEATFEKVANKGAVSGYASLNASTKVVEDPANATATPTASKIPIADGSGLLDGWITAAVGEATVIKWGLILGG